jgi:putative ABC transport system permease protein
MPVPIAYNLRNLRERKTNSMLTALGLALTVAVLLGVMTLVEGLRTTFRATGDPLQIVVLRRGALTELISNLERSSYNDLKYRAGIARGKSGQPMASLEVVTVINLENDEYPEGTNVNFRGLTPIGIEMRRGLAIERGRWFEAGRREVVVGHALAARYPQLALGRQFRFGRGDWEVVGVMRAGESSINSEIFCDLNQLTADENREEVLSSVLLRATDPVVKGL